MPSSIPRNALFVRLDWLFWLVWLLFLGLIWMTFRSLLDETGVQAQLPDMDLACLQALPLYANYSVTGKSMMILNLLLQFAVYALLLFVAHRTIHRCAAGDVFVADTLKTLGFVGWIILAWPVFDLALTNLTSIVLFETGDLKAFQPSYLFDVGPVGVGLLILSMRLVIDHAIRIKQDHDLTI
jgi:Protein of unknown function (DUF2975)